MVQNSFYLSESQWAELSGSSIGNLTPVIAWQDEPLAFKIRDDFDQSIRASGRLFIEFDDSAVLLTASGAFLRQNAEPHLRFASAFAEGPVKDAIRDIAPLRALLPIVEGTARTGLLSLVDDEDKTRVRVRFRVLVPNGGAPVVVATAEGLRGYDKALGEVRVRMQACGGTPLAGGDLYRAIAPGHIPYVGRPVVDIGASESAFDAATDLIAAYLPVARANEAGIIADLDTEFLHDYRIALRKIRSVLSLFKDVYTPEQTLELKTRFSALMAPTGALRDLDVYLLDQQSFFGLVPETLHDGLHAMFALIHKRRAGEQALLAKHLRSEAYRAEIKKLVKLFDKRSKLSPGANAGEHSDAYARELIGKRYRKIRRIASAMTDKTPDAEVHALRIECKKLRYLLEFFGPVLEERRLRAVLKPLKKLQDSLGLFNDYAVQQERLLAFSDALEAEPRKMDIVQSIGALVVVLHQLQTAEREKILASFVDFNSHEMRRAFRRLLRAGKES